MVGKGYSLPSEPLEQANIRGMSSKNAFLHAIASDKRVGVGVFLYLRLLLQG